jgi:outer membrane protein OmpA-like peptidoglycan-associated protein
MLYRFSLLLMFAVCAVSVAGAQDFRVQITARAEPVPESYFKEHGVQHYTLSTDQLGLYRYFAGSYNTRTEAEKVKNEMVEKGFPFAYVIDLEEQRILCGAGCPYFRNGRVFVQDTNQMRRAVYFDFGRYSLTSDAKETLDGVAAIMKTHAKYKLNLMSHTDAVGSAKANAVLAANRARSVRNYLIAHHIRADRMFIKVMGEADPAGDNQNDDGEDLPENRKLNRRVICAITDEGGEVRR